MHAPKRSFFCAGWIGFALVAKLFAGGETPLSQVPQVISPIVTNLVFDADTKIQDVKFDEESVAFQFYVTNLWTNVITVDRMETSCGCTVAKMPSYPWHIPAGGHGTVDATINLKGKGAGQVTKLVTLYVSAEDKFVGTRIATLKVNVPAEPVAPAPTALTEAERKAAMAKAKADPQEIFKNPKCADCHVKQGIDKTGEKLYAADCGICHDSPHRATFVPDLHALKFPTDYVYWKKLLAEGKPNSMMPAFADKHGGPLNDDQVHSLAEYLTRNYSTQGGAQ